MVDIKKMLMDSKLKSKTLKKKDEIQEDDHELEANELFVDPEEIDDQLATAITTVQAKKTKQIKLKIVEPETQILLDKITRLETLLETVPVVYLELIMAKFASLKQWKKIKVKDPVTGEKITKIVPRWSDPLNTEPDNVMRKKVEKWLDEFAVKMKVK